MKKLYCVCGLTFEDKYFRSGHQVDCKEFLKYSLLGNQTTLSQGTRRYHEKRLYLIISDESYNLITDVAKVLNWRKNQVVKWCVDSALKELEKRAGTVSHFLTQPLPRQERPK